MAKSFSKYRIPMYIIYIYIQYASPFQPEKHGQRKNRFTVMLPCTADGGKLPPYVVFKRKTMPKLQFPKGVIINEHPIGWFDDDITKD